MQLTSTKDLAGYTSTALVKGSASASAINTEINTEQSVPLNATESYLVRSAGSLITEFQVSTPTSATVNGRVSVRTDKRNDVQCTLARQLADGSTELVASCVMTQSVSSWGDDTQDPVYARPSGWSAVSIVFAEAPTTLRGPAPTASPDSEDSGPFSVASVAIPKPTGFGRATVHFPSNTVEGPFATVAAVLKQLAAWGFQAGSPLAGKVDSTRVGVIGHGLENPVDFDLDATTLGVNVPNFLMPLAPMVSGRDYSPVKAPVYLIGCINDTLAPIKINAAKILATVAAAGG